MSKLKTIQEKTNEIAAEITAEQQKRDARRAGFDEYADYELWLALDALRRTTLERRSMRAGTQAFVIGDPIVGTVVNNIAVDGCIDAARI